MLLQNKKIMYFDDISKDIECPKLIEIIEPPEIDIDDERFVIEEIKYLNVVDNREIESSGKYHTCVVLIGIYLIFIIIDTKTGKYNTMTVAGDNNKYKIQSEMTASLLCEYYKDYIIFEFESNEKPKFEKRYILFSTKIVDIIFDLDNNNFIHSYGKFESYITYDVALNLLISNGKNSYIWYDELNEAEYNKYIKSKKGENNYGN